MFIYWFFFSLLLIPSVFILPVKVYGKKNIEKGRNYIFVFNHQSNFDGVILDFKLKKRIRYISKKELWKGKKKSFFYDNILGCIPIDRQSGVNLETTKQILASLKNHDSIGIAPEGTRNKESFSDNTEIKNGACLFSIKSKTPLLPCYIVKKQKAFKKNVLIIGEPFELNEFYDKKLTKEVLSEAGEILFRKIEDLKTYYENEILNKKKIKK